MPIYNQHPCSLLHEQVRCKGDSGMLLRKNGGLQECFLKLKIHTYTIGIPMKCIKIGPFGVCRVRYGRVVYY